MANETVIVTGFGPFGKHKINASWESVKLLPNQIDNHLIIKQEIAVAYDTVDDKINKLWQQYNPKLVIHVGVSDLADRLTLEKCANRTGYERLDCCGNLPKNLNECPSKCRIDCLETQLDIEKVCDFVNNNKSVKTCISSNAGRYLCEYTYYTSLDIDNTRALFIHVPPLDKPYSAQEISEGIYEIIRYLLKYCL